MNIRYSSRVGAKKIQRDNDFDFRKHNSNSITYSLFIQSKYK